MDGLIKILFLNLVLFLVRFKLKFEIFLIKGFLEGKDFKVIWDVF